MSDDMDQFAVEALYRTHMRVAEPHSVDDNRVEYRLQVESRPANDFEHVGGHGQLFPRLVQLVSATVELLQEIGSGRTATLRQRIAALQRHRLTASRFNCFAACSGAPSHCLPQGSGQGIVDG